MTDQMSSEEEKKIKVKSLFKAVKVLMCFTAEKPEWGITELADKNGILKSSVHNIMSTYEACGFIIKDKKNGKYRLGLKILELGNVLYQGNDLRQVIKPYMNELSQATDETVFLAHQLEDEVIYLEASFPGGSLYSRNVVGVRAPMYCTAVGKAILAYLSEDAIENIISKGLASFTSHTITDPDLLRQELAAIREQGFAMDNMEHEYGVKCVGIPLRNIKGDIVASMSISGPSLRFSNETVSQYTRLLVTIAAKVKEQIL